ncbi:PSD1 and planctomycete cytochrome C domain-containing protein [Rubinisphaera margarita]|uniref:PSD1 and planctomycete cytochrome C domain-containing protein n=1 Tax=Rubinisphaera margarita TaxID=2909586 RepID=UPI001EE92FD1|nr:PSD1 and planctomycete cytochrome C domain-containing protein [Rubinisphaera margarita]MCG6156972.1 DUF1553 domain-containing protein [Rubinisphaera margarita]
MQNYILAFATLLVSGLPSVFAADVTWEHDVRPLLKQHCFHCHGELGEIEGGLDLRLRKLLVKGGDSGTAIVPGDAEASLLLQRMTAGEMPPDEDKLLSPAEIETIRQWINNGAVILEEEPDEIGDGPFFTFAERNYWAFQPIERPAVPQADPERRARTPIDELILANSEGHPGFAPDADRAKLLRRASIDLTGLPPSPEMLERVLADTSPEWWDKVIEELLASPHYGERWARHWLDVAGYADSEGYTDDDRIRPHAWRYRDYVIRSFENDKPFDQFIQEQLAGDELANWTGGDLTEQQIEQLTATGFLRMAPDGTASGGINPTEARNQVVADTIQIVGSSLLGMTMHCAQCHDHRYDPIPQADYYALRAVFEPALDWKSWKSPPQRQISLYTAADREAAKAIEAQAAAVEKERSKKAEEFITLTLEEELLLIPEGEREAARTAYRTPKKERTAEQQALLKKHPTVASISTGSLYLYDRRRADRARKVDAERKQKEVRFVEETRTAALAEVPEEKRSAVESALATAPAKRTAEQNELLATFPATQVTLETLAEFNPEAAAELKRDEALAAELRANQTAERLKEYQQKAAEIRKQKPKEGFVRALQEPAGKVPQTFVFYRGDPEQPKDVVHPRDLTILGERGEIPDNLEALPTSGRRLAFARQLTDGTHPLLARVIANRIWLHHFGRGIVNTPGDFGRLGDRPTHPELLDWLAAEFQSSGWSVKHLHRVIMKSTAYRQSSVASEAMSADADNVMYSRFPLQRMEAETIRDTILAVTGKLNSKRFGAPIPVMEDSVGQIVLGEENLDGERKPVDQVDLNGEEFRRSIYVQVRRTRTFSMFEAFDAPAMTPNCEIRSTSTVAPQSLFFMNSAAIVEFSEFFAERLLREASAGLPQQVEHAWRLAYAASPSETEQAKAVAFVTAQQELMAKQQPDWDETRVTREALSVFCQALLSSNRFLYIE